MKALLPISLLLIAGSTGSLRSGEFVFPAYTLTVPEGFTVERIAGPPLVDRPITVAFDESGRLYVADSSGSNDPVQKQLEERPHRIVRLEDTDGDGVFDRSVVFADRMMFPEGTLWHDGSLYVSAPPSIWKLTDTNGDGVADRREEWFNGTLTGCANDLHGPYLGLDGWIYWAKGAFAKQSHEQPGRDPLVTRAAHIFRAPSTGQPIESVMTGGMDNPVDVIFTPEGERIFTTTFLQHPQAGRRDGLIHAIYGGVYGKVHDVIDEHPRTGEVLPPLTHLGPAAPSGLEIYHSSVFGEDYRNNLFAALFNMRKVTRHVLHPEGATYRTEDFDFLVANHPDFHPTDVLEDADGSLIVVNTGGWYKICCPTSQLAKPDVLGAIYRVRRTGTAGMEDPRGSRIAWGNMLPEGLTKLLEDPRPAVRARAIHVLASKGSASVSALTRTVRGAESAEARRNAAWALTRIDSAEARAGVRPGLRDKEQSVVHASVHSVALWRDAHALPDLLDLLEVGPAPIQRVCAEALGRIGDKGAVAPLLKASRGVSDRILHHALTYALIEIAAPEPTLEGLRATDSQTRQAALLALDQMKGGGLRPDHILPLLEDRDPALQQTARWIASRHPDWGEALAGFFRQRFELELQPEEAAALEEQLRHFGRNTAIQALLAATLSTEALPKASRLSALRAMARSGARELPPSWRTELQRTLVSSDPALTAQAVRTVRSLPAPKNELDSWSAALREVGGRAQLPAEVRLNALAGIPGSGLASVDPLLFHFLQTHVTRENPVLTRGAAAAVLARARLTEGQLEEFTDVLGTIGPMELGQVLQPFEGGSSEALGMRLLARLAEAPAASAVRPELLEPRLKNFPESVRSRAKRWLEEADQDLPKQQAHLEELLVRVIAQGGDIRRGQAIFNSAQTACSTCHAIGYAGGNLGPDLTSIGKIRTERDLLEAIIYPSASFVRSYEPVVIIARDGEDYHGMLRGEGSEELVIATGPGVEMRIARSNVEEMRPGTVSIMPGGLHEQLSLQELSDLLAFLKAAR